MSSTEPSIHGITAGYDFLGRVELIGPPHPAFQESGRADKRVTARVVHEARRLKLSVVDNGIGILPENLTRIFGQGFATRRKGRGFGLHASAIAAREIGATLVAQSDGPGSGATFTLELPLPSGEEKLQDPGLKNVPPPQNQA